MRCLQEASTIPKEKMTDGDLDKLRSFGAGKTTTGNVGDTWGKKQEKETHLDVEALSNAIHRWGKDKDLSKSILGEVACCV